MPQMGESIAEGTVVRWLKQVGESVQRDEPILEISTDKVDAEIPSPASGVLVEILVGEGETVEVGTVVAFVDTEARPGVALRPAIGEAPPTSPLVREPGEGVQGRAAATSESFAAAGPSDAGTPSSSAGDGSQGALSPASPAGAVQAGEEELRGRQERLRTRSSPLVRRIAEEHGVDLREVVGTGFLGRVTKQDILGFLHGRPGADKAAPLAGTPPYPPEPLPAPAESTEVPRVVPDGTSRRAIPDSGRAVTEAAVSGPSGFWKIFLGEVQHPEYAVRAADRVEPMDKVRRLTAEHMVLAKRVAPHVHSFIEVDFTRVDHLRALHRDRWAQQGVKVSYTAFVAWACSRILREFPTVNATVSGNNLLLRGNVNVGIAVDLNPGLIVPVIHDADELSLVGIAKRMVDLAERARARRLNPEEIQGVTFSVTNPGVLGTLAGTPIIPKGTAAILGTGSIEKRVVVVEDPVTGADTIAIRKRSIFSLGYDHRIVDGADAARFLSRLKELVERFPEEA